MVKAIRAWLKARQQTAAKKRFNEGFNFAAGLLLRNSASTPQTVADAVSGCGFFDPDEFDEGMAAALDEWRKQFSSPASLTFPPIT